MKRLAIAVGLLIVVLVSDARVAALYPDVQEAVSFTCPPEPSEAEKQHRAALRQLWVDGNVDRMREIAETGDPVAQAWMGMMTKRGDGLYWWTLAASQNDRWALHTLASYYRHQEDLATAVMWLRRGAELGYGEMQYELGWVLENRGSEANPDAFPWFLAAANQRYRYAFIEVAEAYDLGQGTPRDAVLAYAYAVAALRTLDSSDLGGIRRKAVDMKTRLGAELSLRDRKGAELREAQITRGPRC